MSARIRRHPSLLRRTAPAAAGLLAAAWGCRCEELLADKRSAAAATPAAQPEDRPPSWSPPTTAPADAPAAASAEMQPQAPAPAAAPRPVPLFMPGSRPLVKLPQESPPAGPMLQPFKAREMQLRPIGPLRNTMLGRPQLVPMQPGQIPPPAPADAPPPRP